MRSTKTDSESGPPLAEAFSLGTHRNKNLRELNLQNNKLKLNQKLKKHLYVETLALQHDQIKDVPVSIRAFKNLKKLNFNHNQISSVHRNLRFLTRLEHLSFYKNQLRAIPDGLYGLTAVREIDLFYNSIETVDESISRWILIFRRTPALRSGSVVVHIPGR